MEKKSFTVETNYSLVLMAWDIANGMRDMIVYNNGGVLEDIRNSYDSIHKVLLVMFNEILQDEERMKLELKSSTQHNGLIWTTTKSY